MDFVQKTTNQFRLPRQANDFLSFSDCLRGRGFDIRRVKYDQVYRIINAVRKANREMRTIWNLPKADYTYKAMLSENIREECVLKISKVRMNPHTMYWLLTAVEREEYADVRRPLFNALFGVTNYSFYALVQDSRENMTELVEDDDGDIIFHGFHFKKQEVENP